MEDYGWLFSDRLSKGLPIHRLADRVIPDTSGYSDVNGLSVKQDVGLSSDEDLAEKANDSLEAAVEHLEVNQATKDALTLIVEELDSKREEYHDANPNPLEPIEKELTDPDWSKLSGIFPAENNNSKMVHSILDGSSEENNVEVARNIVDRILNPKKIKSSPIARVGSEPGEDLSPSAEEIHAKGLQAGMTIEEMKSADTAIDSAFGCLDRGGKGFRAKF